MTFFYLAAVSLIFSFTNGTDWDGPYRLQFQVPRAWRNKPIDFFAEVGNKMFYVLKFRAFLQQKALLYLWFQGLAQELSKEGACERAIFPDTSIIATRCAMIGNLSIEGVSEFDI